MSGSSYSININSSAVVRHTARLERLHRSALPVAVRQTLSKAAFDVKMRTMPAQAGKNFEKREPNFFKANSKVTPAKGFEIRNMKAVIGFVPMKGGNKAVDELQQQEEGGNIGGRSFIATKEARTGGAWNRKVKSDLRLANIRRQKIVNAERVRFKGHYRNKKQRFIRAAIMAKKHYGKNAYVLGNKWGDGNQTLSRIDRIFIDKKNGKIEIKRTPIYTYRKGRKITVARTNFMKRASMESGMNLNHWFQNFAIEQLKKYTTK